MSISLGSKSRSRLWALVAAVLALQGLALAIYGHETYLWVQGGLAALASLGLVGTHVWFAQRGDPRPVRWPGLLPLAAIAGFGAAKNFFVALGVATPIWLVGLLLASVVWFLGDSIRVWRRGDTLDSSGNRG